MRKPKPKKRRPRTLAEKLEPKLKRMRLRLLKINESMMIEYGRRPEARAAWARVARRVWQRLAQRKFFANYGDFATHNELWQLCGAAVSHEAAGKVKRKRPQ